MSKSIKKDEYSYIKIESGLKKILMTQSNRNDMMSISHFYHFYHLLWQLDLIKDVRDDLIESEK